MCDRFNASSLPRFMPTFPRLSILACALLFGASSFAQAPVAPAQPDPAFPPQPAVQPVSTAEEAKTFQLPPGYKLELVLSEPEIKEPAICVFDGDGRMYVSEFLTYMQDIDGSGEMEPRSRMSVHWSSKKDGVYDQHRVFAEGLLLPRLLLPLGKGQVLIGETNTNDVWLYTDTDGDGVSDKKEPWYVGGGRGGNLEHQPNGLLWAIDNGIYTTYNDYCLRWTPTGAVKEKTGANGGQWGLAQDDYGKIFYLNAGGEQGPVSFQVPVQYGQFNPAAQSDAGYKEVFPAIGKSDFQGGLGRARLEDKTLNHFTATCGAEVYRGDRLPKELYGNLFFGEPVGRLIRRSIVENKGGLTYLSNPYQAERSEFIRSTDPLFRPINFMNGPDGTLYVVDMYRGIIQEGNWVREGSYLRKVVQQYSFDKPVGRGRIWRLVHETTKPGPQPQMFGETPAQLVAHLEHPNGWWRDTAQKLLVLAQDKSTVAPLTAMAKTNANPLARIHALWTLDGLGAAEPALIAEKLKDADPQVRVAAIRIGEKLVKNGDTTLQEPIEKLAADASADVALQSMLTARFLNWPSAKETVHKLATTSSAEGVRLLADIIEKPPVATNVSKFSGPEKKAFADGQTIFQTLCATCHGVDGRGLPMVGAAPGARLAPALAGSKTINGPKDGPILVLLHGLSGDIEGKKYEGQMIPMNTFDDNWISSVISYVRNSFGNRGGFVLPAEVKRLRAETAARTQPWTESELRAALPHPLTNRKEWKLNASHNPGAVAAVVDGDPATRYDTKVAMSPGMWFTIELPAETEICGLQLDYAKSANDYPRGYTVELSADGETWAPPVAKGVGANGSTSIDFPATKTKWIRITQTGKMPGTYWSIHELEVLAPAGMR